MDDIGLRGSKKVGLQLSSAKYPLPPPCLQALGVNSPVGGSLSGGAPRYYRANVFRIEVPAGQTLPDFPQVLKGKRLWGRGGAAG
jgi:hypothetical protein